MDIAIPLPASLPQDGHVWASNCEMKKGQSESCSHLCHPWDSDTHRVSLEAAATAFWNKSLVRSMAPMALGSALLSYNKHKWPSMLLDLNRVRSMTSGEYCKNTDTSHSWGMSIRSNKALYAQNLRWVIMRCFLARQRIELTSSMGLKVKTRSTTDGWEQISSTTSSYRIFLHWLAKIFLSWGAWETSTSRKTLQCWTEIHKHTKFT